MHLVETDIIFIILKHLSTRCETFVILYFSHVCVCVWCKYTATFVNCLIIIFTTFTDIIFDTVICQIIVKDVVAFQFICKQQQRDLQLATK